MTQIEITQNGFVVDADVIATAFKLAPEDIHPLMLNGKITSKCETGVGMDAGRSRLTFHYGDRVVRLVVDLAGTILKQASFPARGRAPIAANMSPIPPNQPIKAPS